MTSLKRPLQLVIPSLFLWLVALQFADFYSTLTAPSDKVEQNKLLINLSQYVAFPTALTLVKLFDAALIIALAFYWKRNDGQMNKEWALCLSFACVFYTMIVSSNFN